MNTNEPTKSAHYNGWCTLLDRRRVRHSMNSTINHDATNFAISSICCCISCFMRLYLMIISRRLNNGCQAAKCIGCGNLRVLFDLLIRCASDASAICEKKSRFSSRHDSSLPLYLHKRYCLHCLTVYRRSIKNQRAHISDIWPQASTHHLYA